MSLVHNNGLHPLLKVLCFKHFGNILFVHEWNTSGCPNIKQNFLTSSGMLTFPSSCSSPTLCNIHTFNTPSSFCTWSLINALKGETTITTESCPTGSRPTLLSLIFPPKTQLPRGIQTPFGQTGCGNTWRLRSLTDHRILVFRQTLYPESLVPDRWSRVTRTLRTRLHETLILQKVLETSHNSCFAMTFCLWYILQVWVLYDAQPVFSVMTDKRTQLFRKCRRQLILPVLWWLLCLLYILQVRVLYDAQQVFFVVSDVRTQLFRRWWRHLVPSVSRWILTSPLLSPSVTLSGRTTRFLRCVWQENSNFQKVQRTSYLLLRWI